MTNQHGHLWWILMSSIMLVGCRANQEVLTDYLAEISVQREVVVEDIELAPAFQVFDYAQHQGRDPFILPRGVISQTQSARNAQCWQPKPRKGGGDLERYPLDKLNLRGVMSREGQVTALIQTPDGMILSANQGQYLGLNNGRILRINNDQLLVEETLPDGLGCWHTRNMTLAMKTD